MSTLPAGFEPLEEAAPGAPRPLLHVVPVHEHTWQLRGVEYDDSFAVSRFECDCGEVLFT